MGDLKGNTNFERGRCSRTLLEDATNHLLETRAAAVFHVWQLDGFRFSMPETEMQPFIYDGSAILLTCFFVPQMLLSRQNHHLSTNNAAAFFSAI